MNLNIYPIHIEREWKQNGIRIQSKINCNKTEKIQMYFCDFYVTNRPKKSVIDESNYQDFHET